MAMVINVYIDTKINKKNKFDHPTDLDNFENENTFAKTLASINNLKQTNDKLSLYIFAVAAGEDRSHDQEIKKKMNKILRESSHQYYLFTNSDVKQLNNYTDSRFFSVNGYPEIRNLGLIIPSLLNQDIIIQIDDDELLREDYLITLKKILKDNPDKYLFTAPYEKNGTTEINNEDPLKSWRKFYSMQKDMNKLMKDKSLKETLFGFGGNMIIRNELAEKSLYPSAVPRGEDFSYLLASRLIYENGNPEAEIEKKNEIYKAYFSPLKELTIIHEPPAEAESDFLFYLEKNLKRFIMEWSIFNKQDNLSVSELKKLSYYLAEMFGYDDFKSKLLDIIEEVKVNYDSKTAENFEKEILSFYDQCSKINRFELYKKDQSDYIDFLDNWKDNNEFRELLLSFKINRNYNKKEYIFIIMLAIYYKPF